MAVWTTDDWLEWSNLRVVSKHEHWYRNWKINKQEIYPPLYKQGVLDFESQYLLGNYHMHEWARV